MFIPHPSTPGGRASPSSINRGRKRNIWLMFLLISNEMFHGVRAEFSYEAITAVLASINISYTDPVSKDLRSVTSDIGRFAEGAIGSAGGVLVGPIPPKNATSRSMYLQGCVANWATPPNGGEPWVALLVKGGCSDAEKVRLAMDQNASAVLLFGNNQETYMQKDSRFKEDAVVVYLLQSKGEQLSGLLRNRTKVFLSIARGQEVKIRITSINRTSVLFVSVSFIVLMVVSLAWLIFYYIQRFRYINAKDRLARHLNNAAKKALSKIPVRTVKTGDKALAEAESCAVCIETYQVGDTLRSLPCKHEFHKSCVDPWLLEHRTCPMCKMDILKHYGYVPCNGPDSPTGGGGGEGGGRGGGGGGGGAGGGGNRGGGSRALAVVESSLVTLEEGTNTRGGISAARTPFQTALQVSVISHSELLPHPPPPPLPPSTSPSTTDLPPSLPQCPSLSLRTTTAVIRSMLLSARSPQVVPVTCVEEVAGLHRPRGNNNNNNNNNHNSNSNDNNNNDSLAPVYFTTEGCRSVKEVGLASSDSSSELESIFYDEDSQSQSSEIRPESPDSAVGETEEGEEIREEIEGEREEEVLEEIKEEEEEEVEEEDGKSGSSSLEWKSRSSVCDIECLVTEIFDLERDTSRNGQCETAVEGDDAGADQPADADDNTPTSHPPSTGLLLPPTPPSLTPPSLTPPSLNTDLPIVDCNHDTSFPLHLNGSSVNPLSSTRSSMASNLHGGGFGSSPFMEESTEERRRKESRDSTGSNREEGSTSRRPSSHVVSVTHS